MKVINKTPPMTLSRQLRIVLKAKLDCPAQDLHRDDIPVSLRYDFAVDASGSSLAGSPMILSRLGDSLNLILGEPFRQPWIFPDYPA